MPLVLPPVEVDELPSSFDELEELLSILEEDVLAMLLSEEVVSLDTSTLVVDVLAKEGSLDGLSLTQPTKKPIDKTVIKIKRLFMLINQRIHRHQ